MPRKSKAKVSGVATAAELAGLKNLAELIERHAQVLASGKQAYELARELEEPIVELMRALPAGTEVPLEHGRTAVLVDQFAKKNVVWKPAGVQRFMIELREPK